MEIINNTYKLDNISPCIEKYFDEETLFFDIECTGLSSKTAFVYLIGCASRKEDNVTITQFFAHDYSDEKELLIVFNDYLKNFSKLLGFSSTRFDEPFLLARYKKYAIDSDITKLHHKDLYLSTVKAKALLDLQNYKQKSIEEFLDLYREDKYNGGELIPVYNEYSDTDNEELKKLVLLHNYEDVKGMIHIIDILSYVELLDAEISNVNYKADGESILFTANTNISVPKQLSKTRDFGLYLVKNNTVSGSLKIYSGTLNTYLEDYRNYYYLIDEDIIVPKIIGASIDKNSRRNATKKDCKVSHEGTFVQIPEGLKTGGIYRTFKEHYDAHKTYILLDDFNEELLAKIIKFMFSH